MARSRLHRRYVKARSNPPLFRDILEFVGPGFAAFAATRFVSYVSATQIAKRAPKWGKHAGAVTAVGSFLGAWFLAHRVKFLEKYHTPIVVGAALAGLQSLIQLYIPQLGWMLADPTPEMAQQQELSVPSMSQMALQPTDEDPNEFVYNEAFDAGRMSPVKSPPIYQAPPKAGPAKVPPTSAPAPDDMGIDDLGDEDLGVFSQN